MARGFRETFQWGAERVVAVGTDAPGITDSLVEEAFESLGGVDVVLGPARDGGYYLIGLRETAPKLFDDVPWGTEKVLQKTKETAERLGLSVRFLTPLDDVDRPEDLPVWEECATRGIASPPSPRLSIIIPTLNEAENIADTLASTRGGPEVEVIVVDGGSRDRTCGIAKSRGAKVITSLPGRARQSNCGAANAEGETLLFLHGDTRLPERFEDHVYQTFVQPGTVAGAFKLRIDESLVGIRLIEWVANLRSTWFGLPYGDQAIFVGAGLFGSLGGFPEMPIMEDFELIRRLRRLGRIRIVPAPVLTSARRWERIGIWRAAVINYAIPLAYYAGVSPSRLVRWYRRRE
jgi:rSAM/selenodomain-associated transferase 2